MCGRYTLISNAEAIRHLFRVAPFDERLAIPRYNIAPTQPIVVVREGVRGRELVPVRWGFIPAWIGDPKGVPPLFNARAEGIAEKASFRNAVRRRRCLVPASGFYEWRKGGRAPKQPFAVRPEDASLIAFAGVWETWCGNDGSEIDTAAIVTVPADENLAVLHDRMPAIIAPADFDVWLSSEHGTEEALALLGCAPETRLACVPVSMRVNTADNDDPSLWRRVEIEEVPADTRPAQGQLF